MDRLACVDVAAFPLQLLLRRHPDWAALPVVVVEDDRPHALVLHLNARARRAGVRSGQRYATALALARDLHAGTVAAVELARAVHDLTERLRRYSPHVEPSADAPGVFWLDARGLDRLHPSLPAWAAAVRADLAGDSLRASVAVAFSRFGAYALAAAHRTLVVCADAAEEAALVRDVPLARLALDPDARDRLFALGITTVGGFLRLPGGDLRTRFGPAAEALYRLAAGQRWAPLVPAPPDEPHERAVDFDTAEAHVERLVFVAKRLLDGLVAELARQALAVTELVLRLTLDDRRVREERIRPAAPTLDAAQLLTLVRLRLDTIRPTSQPGTSGRGIVALRVTAAVCPATAEQRRLFATQARRDAAAANDAFARLRAECGEQSVVRARLRDAHLPAARFAWEPLAQAPERAAPRVVAGRPLVRRLYATPVPVPAPRQVRRLLGPYVVSGGWWSGLPPQGGVQRHYYFAHTGGGELWWLYYDVPRARFFLQGRVE